MDIIRELALQLILGGIVGGVIGFLWCKIFGVSSSSSVIYCILVTFVVFLFFNGLDKTLDNIALIIGIGLGDWLATENQLKKENAK